MDQLLAKVLPLAFASAISPTVLAMSLLILSGKERPRLKAFAFLAGEALVPAVLTALGLLLAGGEKSSAAPKHAVIDAVLGLLLMILGAAALAIKPGKSSSAFSRLDSGPERRQIATCGLMGLLSMGMNFSSQVPFLTAVREVARASVSYTVQGIVLGVAWIFLLLPTLLPLVLYVVAPTAAARLLTPLSVMATKYGRYLVAAIFLILGAVFLWRGNSIAMTQYLRSISVGLN